MCTINGKHLIYGCRDMEFVVILDHFWHFYAQTTPKRKIWKNLKKPREIIILYIRTKNDSHMMYDSCDMERGGLIFLSFWTIFCSFTIQKIKIFRKKKALGDIIILHKCTYAYCSKHKANFYSRCL